MDKLRALQYFVAAAQEHSLSGAARRLDVSLPAVAKLVTSLERSLDTTLFDRTVRGLKLTADGVSYLEACQPLLEQLAAADEAIGAAAARPRGTLVVGTPPQLAQHCLVPAIPRFHARYPDIQIDLRTVSRVTDPEASAVDVFVVLGWPEHADLVHRRIALTRLLTCAAPAYWAAHGVPRHPRDLKGHICLPFRNPEGTLVDLWQYDRNEERESVTVSGWFMSNHRDNILDAVIAGEGVARLTDLTIRSHLSSGRIVPVFLDWEMKDAPPINLLSRPNHRRTPRVRVFIDFIIWLFRELEAAREGAVSSRNSADLPYWHRRRHGRASAAVRRQE